MRNPVHQCKRTKLGLIILFISLKVGAQDLILTSQADLDSINPSIELIEGSLLIGLDSIESDILNLENLSNLNRISGSLRIKNNDSLVNLDGLRNLTYIGEDLFIRSNNNLQDISGLENISFVGDDVSVISNEQLEAIEVLEQISVLNGGLHINNNSNLKDISGLRNLNYIDGHLIIFANKLLEHIDDLNNVDSVGLHINISENESLKNIDGLRNIKSIGFWIQISGNFKLSDCCAIKELLLNKETSIGSSLILISSNMIGCISEEAIISNCSSIDTNDIELLKIFPNPTKRNTTVLSENFKISKIEILDQLGRLVFFEELSNVDEIEVSLEKPGLYIIRVVSNENHKYLGKVLVVN